MSRTSARTLIWRAVIGPITVLCLSARLGAQQPMTILDSYTKAHQLLESAVAAHGGLEALTAARQMRLTARGFEYHPHQSRRVEPPFDSTVTNLMLITDIARGRVIFDETRGYPGGFYYTTRNANTGSGRFNAQLRNRTYVTQQDPPATDMHGDLFLLPQFRLLPIYRSGSSALRSLGQMRLTSGAVVDAIQARLPNGGQMTLGFDPATHRLRALLGVSPNFPGGDQAVETELLDYRMLNGVLLPTEWVTRRAGVVIQRYRYTSAELGYQIPDSLLRPPAGFTLVTPRPAADPVRTLAPGVWAIQAGGYWTLVAEFQDHVLVVDASSSGASDVLTRVATLAPNKPVRWVVPTHHHSDHFGGVRAYAAAGATTVTTPGNLDLFRRVVAAPMSTMSPNAARLPAGAAPRVEAIAGKRRVFTDGTRTVEIHDVGPTPHAEEALVAWVPSAGILFHADLIEAADGVALPGSSSPTTVRLAEYIRSQGWDVRVFAGAHGFLDDPSQFEALVRLPVLPPE